MNVPPDGDALTRTLHPDPALGLRLRLGPGPEPGPDRRHVDLPGPRHVHLPVQEVRRRGVAGQQGAAAVRAAVAGARPGALAVLPLPRAPRRRPPRPPAQRAPRRRRRPRPGRPAAHRLPLGRAPGRAGQPGAAGLEAVQKRSHYFRNKLNRSNCINAFSK